MADDIKNLLDSIIDDTNSSYPGKGEYNSDTNRETPPITFDKGQFREKLSMKVLKDLVCAMMHDETKDLDNMIDESIMRHIRDDYNGTCYDYLKNSRDKLKSPLLTDIIQEIDDKTDEIADTISKKKDSSVADKIDTSELLKDVDNYDLLRKKLKEQVSQQVVEDVTKVVTTSNEAPVFNIDKIDKNAGNTNDDEDITNESVILRMCGSIVTESAIAGNRISTEEGINRAIVEYCIAEMDALFKQSPKVNIYAKYL